MRFDIAPDPIPSGAPAQARAAETRAASATAPSASPAASPTASAPSTPDARSTTFQAVEGGGETRSGETLLVEAYAAIWIILMGYIVLLWRKQAGFAARLDGLEKAIDRAAAKAEKQGKA